MWAAFAATALAALAAGAHAQSRHISTQCFNDICYGLNIPKSTAQSGAGDIYFQISGPTTYSWIGLGQGTGMANSNIFVIYEDGRGNITLSPRRGVGHVEPQHDTSAKVTLLEGSGVANGRMVANVLCANCESWKGGSTDFTSGGGDWLHAALSGSPIQSQQVDQQISIHSTYGPFSWSYARAKGGSSSVNPFVTKQASSSDGDGNGNGSISPAPINIPTTGGSGDSSSGSTTQPTNMMFIAHGTVAAVAFLVFFPLGALSVRVPSLGVWVHAGIQLFAYFCFIGAAGLGIYIAQAQRRLKEAHPIIGMVLLGVIFFQPLGGILHHRAFKVSQGRTVMSHVHVWVGRAAVLLGIINGGLGIQLAADVRRGYVIAYGVVAGIMGVLFIASSVYGETRVARRPKADPRGGTGSETRAS